MTAPLDYRKDIVTACKMLVRLGLDSGPFGNISIRSRDNGQFYINPLGITFDQIKVDDIVQVDLNGRMQSGKNAVHPGAYIHQQIYRIRPDVQSIVHTHSENTVLISLLGCPIEPFTQLGASLFNDQAIYHGFSGPVRDTDEGLAIAKALEDKSIVIAKNHGLFTVSHCIQSALWDMIIADSAAKIHLSAKKLGLEHAEPLLTEDYHKSRVEVREKQYQFMWDSLQY